MHLSKKGIEQSDSKFRLNLINSVSGIKAANLIGSISNSGQMNVSVFSSVIHLGSNPAILGFVMRPTGEVPRNTYDNILENGFYTINAVPKKLVRNAHFTSAKFDQTISEFEVCHIEPKFYSDFKAPYVAESPIKIAMKFIEEIPIRINGTRIIVGSVEQIIIDNEIVDERGYIDFSKAEMTGIGGLNTYFELDRIGEFPYARVDEIPDF